MPNMTYCMFENTHNDLSDCYNKLANDGIKTLSLSERNCAKKLIELCRNLSDDFEHEIEND